MTWKLTEDEVVKYWELIKYGMNQTDHPPDPETYFLGILKNFLLGKLNCVFVMDDQRNIKLMAVIRITEDFGGIRNLVIDCLYGFKPTTNQEKEEGINFLIKFAKNLKLNSILGYISNPQVWPLAGSFGLRKIQEVYQMKIGEI